MVLRARLFPSSIFEFSTDFFIFFGVTGLFGVASLQGSMMSVLTNVRQKIQETVGQLMCSLPELHISVISFGDYTDTRPMEVLDFTRDEKKLCKFVKTVPPTAGGDAPEACEWSFEGDVLLVWLDEDGVTLCVLVVLLVFR